MSMEPPTPDPDDGAREYDIMLEKTDIAIEQLPDKIENGRIRDPEHEKVRIKQYRGLAYLIRTKRKVVEDKTLEELSKEVEELRDAQEGGVGLQ